MLQIHVYLQIVTLCFAKSTIYNTRYMSCYPKCCLPDDITIIFVTDKFQLTAFWEIQLSTSGL